jgi:hypothetical protein
MLAKQKAYCEFFGFAAKGLAKEYGFMMEVCSAFLQDQMVAPSSGGDGDLR